MMQPRNQQGQGILETVIAIGVIVTALVGTITLVAYTLRSSTSTLNRLTAQALAWEAVEVAVNYRDSNFLAGDPFNTGLTGDGTAIATFDEVSNLWVFDFLPNSISDDDAVMYRQGGLYTQATTTPPGSSTMFRRLIEFDTTNPDQVAVTATVQWSERGDDFQVSAYRTLYNWR